MKEERIQITGGAQIGWMNAGWPFARLSISPSKLTLSVSLSGTYEWTPDDVVSVVPHGWVPLLGRGIRIVHVRPDYPAKIIFWSFRDPERIVEDIRLSGFLPRASSASLPMRSGMPFRWPAVILIVLVWNVLFVLDGFVAWKEPRPPGPFVQMALALVFVAAFSTQRSEAVQRWVLRSGRTIGEIRPFLLLLQVVSGFLFVIFTFFRFVEPSVG